MLRPAPAPARGFTMPALLRAQVPTGARPIAVVDDRGGVAELVAAGLRARGLTAAVVQAVADPVGGVINLAALRHVGDVADALAVARAVFADARAVAAGMAGGGLWVTVQPEDDRAAWVGGITALTKTCALEWPAADVKSIRLTGPGRPPARVAELILDELFRGGPEVEVLLPDRAVPVPVPLTDPPPGGVHGVALTVARPLADGAVVVVSGGARGITGTTIRALAGSARLRLAVLGRTDPVDEPAHATGAAGEIELKQACFRHHQAAGRQVTPLELAAEVAAIMAGREIRGTLAAAEAAGSQIRYLPVDVRDAVAVEAALARIRGDWGPIDGLVHGAGVLADKLIVDKTSAAFDRVVDTKVLGLANLLTATATDPLRLIALFSSIAARHGNRGQADYALANATLDRVARAEAGRRPSCRVVSIGWGPWAAGMVEPALRAAFEAHGVSLIPADLGVPAFLAEIARGPGEPAEVVLTARPSAGSGTWPAGTAPRSAGLAIDVRRYPFLLDHRVNGRAVVPIVMVAEWFAAAAAAHAAAGPGPDSGPPVVRDLRVRKGIGLGEDGDSATVTISARPALDGRLDLRLTGADGTLHYTATADRSPCPPAVPAPSRRFDQPVPDAGEHLFHGPAFRGLGPVRLGPAGGDAMVAARIADTWAMAEPDRPVTDVVALDCGLQLAGLWAARQCGGDWLPTRIGRVDPVTGSGPYRAVLTVTHHDRLTVRADVVFTDTAGLIRGALTGVELFPFRRSS